jgi:hypothetical protein
VSVLSQATFKIDSKPSVVTKEQRYAPSGTVVALDLTRLCSICCQDVIM